MSPLPPLNRLLTKLLNKLVLPEPAAPRTKHENTFLVTFFCRRSVLRGFVTLRAVVVGMSSDEGADVYPRLLGQSLVQSRGGQLSAESSETDRLTRQDRLKSSGGLTRSSC